MEKLVGIVLLLEKSSEISFPVGVGKKVQDLFSLWLEISNSSFKTYLKLKAKTVFDFQGCQVSTY